MERQSYVEQGSGTDAEPTIKAPNPSPGLTEEKQISG